MKESWVRMKGLDTDLSMLWGEAWMAGKKVGLLFKSKVSEHTHQVALFRWAEYIEPLRPELKLMFAVPNGGKRDKTTAAKLKEEGVKPGVPDVVLPIPRAGFAGLFIEMKKPDGRARGNQSEWSEGLKKAGNRAEFCYGFEEAKKLVCEYLDAGRGVG